MVTRSFEIKLTVNVRAEEEKDLPDQREVENLTCGLLLTPPATEPDTRWSVYSTHLKEEE